MSEKTDHTPSELESPELVDVLKLFPRGSKPTEDECASKKRLNSYPPPRGGVNVNWWIRNGHKTRYHQLFDSDTSSDDGEDLDYLPSYTTRTQAQRTLNEQPGSDMSSESIEAFCRDRIRDSLAGYHHNIAAKALAQGALAYPGQLRASDLEEHIFFIVLRIQGNGKFKNRIRVSTVLALTLHEDYGLRKKMARIFYDELQREPNASRLPTLVVSYGQTIRNAQAFIPRDLSAALRCLKELAKQRELGTIIAAMPDEKPKRANKQDTAVQKDGGKSPQGLAVC